MFLVGLTNCGVETCKENPWKKETHTFHRSMTSPHGSTLMTGPSMSPCVCLVKQGSPSCSPRPASVAFLPTLLPSASSSSSSSSSATVARALALAGMARAGLLPVRIHSEHISEPKSDHMSEHNQIRCSSMSQVYTCHIMPQDMADAKTMSGPVPEHVPTFLLDNVSDHIPGLMPEQISEHCASSLLFSMQGSDEVKHSFSGAMSMETA